MSRFRIEVYPGRVRVLSWSVPGASPGVLVIDGGDVAAGLREVRQLGASGHTVDVHRFERGAGGAERMVNRYRVQV